MSGGDGSQILRFGPFTFETPDGLLYRAGVEVPLPPRVVGLLEHLLERPGALVSRQELLEDNWNGTAVTEQSLTDAVRILRQALDDDPQRPTYVQTVHRRGYRFIAEVTNGRPEEEPPAIEAPPPEPTPPTAELAAAEASGAGARGSLGRAMAWTALAMLGGLAIYVGASRNPAFDSPPGEPIRFQLPYPEDHGVGLFELSPDGRRIAYDVRAVGRWVPRNLGPSWPVYLHQLDRFEPTPIPGTEGAAGPFFSPDGERVAYFTRLSSGETHRLHTTDLDGSGSVVVLPRVSMPQPGGATWGDDGYIYYGSDDPPGIHRVPEDGGDPEQITFRDPSRERLHRFPQVLPDGRGLLFSVQPESRGPGDWQVAVASIETSERHVVLTGSSRARYLPSGHLVHGSDGRAWIQEFDLDTLQLGTARARIELPTGAGAAGSQPGPRPYGVARNGTLAYRIEPQGPEIQTLARIDGEGRITELGLTQPSSSCVNPRVSPDGTMIAATCVNPSSVPARTVDIYVGRFDNGAMERRTFEGTAGAAIWSPHGDSLIYAAHVGDSWTLRSTSSGDEREPIVLVRSPYTLSPEAISPDGAWLVYQEIHPDTGEDLRAVPTSGGTPTPLLVTEANESGAEISPDGRWIAYHSDTTGEDVWHVFVASFPTPGPEVQISTREGGWPQWTADGRRLLYMTAAGEAILSVNVATRNGFRASAPEELFENEALFMRRRLAAAFVVAPTGDDLYVSVREWPARPVRIVVNWLDHVLGSLTTQTIAAR